MCYLPFLAEMSTFTRYVAAHCRPGLAIGALNSQGLGAGGLNIGNGWSTIASENQMARTPGSAKNPCQQGSAH